MTEANDSAMPYVVGGKTLNGQDDYITHGLSKREYFAARAMQGMLGDQRFIQSNQAEDVASYAVRLADALINELNK